MSAESCTRNGGLAALLMKPFTTGRIRWNFGVPFGAISKAMVDFFAKTDLQFDRSHGRPERCDAIFHVWRGGQRFEFLDRPWKDDPMLRPTFGRRTGPSSSQMAPSGFLLAIIGTSNPELLLRTYPSKSGDWASRLMACSITIPATAQPARSSRASGNINCSRNCFAFSTATNSSAWMQTPRDR